MDSWKELETNLKQTGSLIDAKTYREFIGQKNNNQLPIRNCLIETSWHSWKGFFYGVSTKKFQDFIHKWEIKEASPSGYSVISQNEVLNTGYQIRQNKSLQKPIRISNNLLFVLLWVVAIIIAGIVLSLR